jgi:glycerol kinase
VRILAIDQGTSATKALVVEADGTVAAEVEVPVEVHTGADGAVEVDPEDLWSSVLAAGAASLEASGGSVDGVGLGNQGETILAWERQSGRPRSTGIVWQDRRSAALCAELSADGWSERLRAITGLELDPYFVAPKVAWLREQLGGASSDPAVAITTTDVWLLHRLCGGGFVTDAATASRTLLLDLDRVAWSAEAAEAFEIDVADLPDIVDNATVVGVTTAFGGDEVPVAGACVDQQAALFAESCWAAGEAKCTYGTGAFLLATTGAHAVRSGTGLVGCVAWRLGGQPTWCLDGQVFTVGAAVGWLQSVGVISAPSDLDRLGGSVTDGGGAVFVPGLAGLGAPFWAPHARGAFTGLSLATERAHLVRAAIEGIAAQVAWLARAAGEDLGRPLERLRVDGGLTRSRTLLQVQADLLQAPVEVYPSPHATALGVAALARLGLAGGTDPASALPAWQPVAVVEPAVSADEAEHRLTAWRAVAEATLGL